VNAGFEGAGENELKTIEEHLHMQEIDRRMR
jgi:hypothetical protein